VYLSRVRVRNFRNLRDLEVGFSNGLNVIVGENNVGKTNLLEAIRAALGPASFVGDPLRLVKEDRHRSVEGVYATAPIAVDLWFDDLSADEQAECLEILDYDAATPAKSKASIHFEWSWDEKANRWHARRWGGDRPKAEAPVPEEVLQSIPLTLLGALRDALVALSPGRMSRLGQLLRAVATPDEQKSIETILEEANARLETDPLITGVESKIGSALKQASGPRLGQEAVVRATEPNFDRIVNNLRLVLRERGSSANVLSELRSNGLGFNNLLYIATVLAELDASKEATLPLLLVEEPEAHLHPQLQTLLADHLARGGVPAGDKASRVQTIVTTHSPTVAAHVQPEVIRVLHRNQRDEPRCAAIGACGLAPDEAKKLRRMLDVTKATMLFARSVVLVEGISESLLLPVLARRLGDKFDLGQASVAVVPMAGVDFATFGKLFGDKAIDIPVAIVTDGDPTVEFPDGKEEWSTAKPKEVGAVIEVCDRVKKLVGDFAANKRVRIFHSAVTLEYDLASAAFDNGLTLFDAWKSCYERRPKKLVRTTVEAATTAQERALFLWRAICLGDPAHGKAEVAQALAGLLDERKDGGAYAVSKFEVPQYLRDAFTHVLPSA
jgi:putative ATP-dependent endonuclease of the OLD family